MVEKMKDKKRPYSWKQRIASIMVMITLLGVTPVNADTLASYNTKIKKEVIAEGWYSNWDGVSNVAQFVNEKGRYSFAYDDGKYVVVVRTKNGKASKNTIKLKKKHSIFGDIVCDSKGNYYVVTGENNDTEDTEKNTIFISKYDKNGKHIKTVGDNGSAGLGYWYGSGFYAKRPFHGGNCDAAINGDVLTVNYAREMYSGHQSNTAFTINTKTMKKIDIGNIYNSHSFAQRAIPYKDGFILASEGDCYSRAFTINYAAKDGSFNHEGDSFHFWVKEGTLSDWNMSVLNNNYARMGGVAAVNDSTVCLVGQSVKALDQKANTQNQQIFIQIFDPTADLSREDTYVTKGTRSGMSGPNGNEKVTDYGVKWLTKSNTHTYSEPQVVSDGKGHIIVLFEERAPKDSYSKKYLGVYYMVLNEKGEVITPKTLYSSSAQLNSCEMPVYAEGTVYWTANEYNDSKHELRVYALAIDD